MVDYVSRMIQFRTIAIVLGIIMLSYAMVYFREHPKASIIAQISIIMNLLYVYFSVHRSIGKIKGILLITALGLFAVIIETIGLITSIPYGSFTYGEKLGFKLFQLTPWTVFFAWTPLVISSFTVIKKLGLSLVWTIVLSSCLLVAIDLVLDPVAVKLGFWRYSNPGLYFEVPLSNYLGWMFSGIIGMVVAHQIIGAPPFLAIHSLTSYLMFTLLFWSFAALWLGLPIVWGIGIILLLIVQIISSIKIQKSVTMAKYL